jgi:EpsI family protein
MTRPRTSLPGRLTVLAAVLAMTALASGYAGRTEAAHAAASLASLPRVIDGWRGLDRPELPADELAALGVDAHVDRSYRRAGAAVGLYVGYYGSQRQGDTVHSPMNCLPGTGWAPVESGTVTLTVPRGPSGVAAPISVRRLRVQRGTDEALVLYWYQSRGRVTASDYWSKAYLMYDAIRLNRTDTALVRVFSMVDGVDGGPARAQHDVTAFVRSLMPVLDRHLPD